MNHFNLINANIITGVRNQPQECSLTVLDGKIISLGSVDQSAKIIDLHGATVTPGITDAHFHLKNFGKRLEQLPLKGKTSVIEITEMVRKKLSKTPTGSWITGFGWDQSLWSVREFPKREILNSIATEHPVMLTRIDGHSIWVNDVALQLAGYDVNDPISPEGGQIINGCILLDNAINLVRDAQSDDSFENVKRWIKTAAYTASERGITNVHDAWQDINTVNAIKELIVEDDFPIRCYGMLASAFPELLDEHFNSGHYNSEKYTIRSVKAFIDGALGSRGAALLEPYSDDHENCGLILISPKEFTDLAKRCIRAKFQLCTHAIGDRGNRMVLDVYEDSIKNVPNHRWRIEHAQMVTDEDIPRFSELQIIPSMQPSHCTSDMRWLDARIGEHRSARISRWQTFIDIGLSIPGGSDCPIEDGEPLFEYFAAVTRQDQGGWPKNGWQKQEIVSRMDALKMFTTWAAYGEFSENRRGLIKYGYDADLTIFSKDITKCSVQEILKAEVLGTIVNGRFVYSNNLI